MSFGGGRRICFASDEKNVALENGVKWYSRSCMLGSWDDTLDTKKIIVEVKIKSEQKTIISITQKYQNLT